jgi:hypothetical protein
MLSRIGRPLAKNQRRALSKYPNPQKAQGEVDYPVAVEIWVKLTNPGIMDSPRYY